MSMLQRAQELTVQASNGAESATDLSSTADEIDQLADAIKQEANTQYNGQYIFSGTASTTQPYSTATGDTYQGNTAAVTRQIGPGSTLQVNVDISSVLGSGTSANDGKLLDTLRSIAADMRSGTSAGVADLSTNQLTNLQNSLNSLTQLQANVRRHPEPPDAGRRPHPGASEQRHRGSLQRRGRQHGPGHDHLLQSAGGLHRRAEGGREYRSVVVDGLPELLS